MDRARVPGRPMTILVAALLMTFTVTATWAVVDDYALSGNLPLGAKVAGIDIGEMSRADASRVIEDRVKGPLLSPVAVTFNGKTTTADPAILTTIDVQGILDRAGAPKAMASLPQRILWRSSRQAYGIDIAEVVTVDAGKLTEWVAAQKAASSVPAVDATVSVSGSKLTIKPAQPGISFDATEAASALSQALLSGTKTVALKETTTSPRVTDAQLGKTIFVSRSRRTLVLYDGARVEKRYRCAVGTPAFPTPTGIFRIELKRYRPTWSNPGSDWAKSMPAYIGPGPGNPLGTRALNIDSPGIRIHGTSKDYSIGTAASHGCMRMHMWDVEDLYDRVKVGTRVIIVS